MPRARATPNLVITIPPNPTTTAYQNSIEPTTTNIPDAKTSCCRPTIRLLLRIFPWVVGCTLVLWIFVLQVDKPPLHIYSPQRHPPYKSRPLHHPYRHSKSYTSSSVWEERAENVRNSFIHAFSGYRQYETLYDVVLPVTGGSANKYVPYFLVWTPYREHFLFCYSLNGWGLTLYDSLDTMWIMGLHRMFRESLGTIASASFSPEIVGFSTTFLNLDSN